MRISFVFLAAVGSASSAVTLRVKAPADVQSYSFSQFVHDFHRSYAPNSAEYRRRSEVFHASLMQIISKNARNLRENRLWTAGIHEFMDWTQSERKVLHGYKPSFAHRGVAALQTQTAAKGHTAELARTHMNLTAYRGRIRNQGNCGSCWAVSAAEAAEAQLQKQGADPNVRVAVQALVDCVPNPHHCGGSGGCEGATGELAYSFMRDVGIPLESSLPYQAETQACPVGSDAPWPTQQRVRVSGWKAPASNHQAPLMQALVEDGPAVVSVDANNWFDYQGGIFDDCPKDADLGHAVLAKGYGEDDAGHKYWYIQNSWGANWGEHGHVRLLRHDDEDSWCGTDHKPEDGSGCDGGPKEVTVCGTCGILYEPLVPQGVRLEDGSAVAAPETPSASDGSAYKVWHADDHTDLAATSAGAKTDESGDDVKKTDDSGDDVKKMDALFRSLRGM